MQGAEVKFEILEYDNKRLYYKTELILILKKWTMKSEDRHKTVNLLNMATICLNYCINTPSKRFAFLQN